MVTPNPLGLILEEEFAGFLLACAFKNGIVVLAALGVEDAPSPLLILKAIHIRPAATDGVIAGTASFLDESALQFMDVYESLHILFRDSTGAEGHPPKRQ